MEALQLCTLLLPPSSRRKLQLLMRMMSRISQNVDMPRLHTAIGTRTLVRTQSRLSAEREISPLSLAWHRGNLNPNPAGREDASIHLFFHFIPRHR